MELESNMAMALTKYGHYGKLYRMIDRKFEHVFLFADSFALDTLAERSGFTEES